MDAENFATAPLTLGERRSERTASGADWSPRDVLVNLLRSIDSGEIGPTVMVVMYATPGKGHGTVTLGYSAASPDPITTHGLIAMAQQRMIRDGDV